MVLYVLYIRYRRYRLYIGILDFLVHFQLFPAQQVTFCEIEVVNPSTFFASISAEDMITFLIVGTSFAPIG